MEKTSLSRIEGTSVEYLSQVSAAMKDFLRNESEEALEVAVNRFEQKPGLIGRLFPTKFEKAKQEVAAHQLRQIAGNKQAMLALYSSIEMEIARKEGDALIGAVGMNLQVQLAKFAVEKIAELETTIGESQSDFMKRYIPRKEEIRTYESEHPELYDRAMESLKHQFDIYFDTTDELLHGFQQALANRLPKS